MKRIIAAVIGVGIMLCGCTTGVPQADYDKVASERDQLKTENEELRQSVEDAQSKLAKMTGDESSTEEVPKLTLEQFQELAESPSYDDLSRYPDKYKTIPIKVTVYVKEARVGALRGLLDGGYLCTINGQDLAVSDIRSVKEPKLLEGDTVTIYGYGGGSSIMQRKQKGTIIDKVLEEWYIPAVNIEYVSIQ